MLISFVTQKLAIYVDESVGSFFWPNHLVAVVLRDLIDDQFELTSEENSQIGFYGSYTEPPSITQRARRKLGRALGRSDTDPVKKVFFSIENVRPDFEKFDFCITSDLAIQSENHLRLPYWKQILSWPCMTEKSITYSRFGELLDVNRLLQPLGDEFLERPQRGSIICRHLTEPRASLLASVRKVIEVDGFGGAFNRGIAHHNQSGFEKNTLLKDYGFNLCPENSMHPGWYTEKVPEAFYAGCLPIGWCDSSVSVDFNPDAFVNMYQPAGTSYDEISEQIVDRDFLSGFVDQPLLLEAPNLNDLEAFLQRLLGSLS